jgi:hypothetical protein
MRSVIALAAQSIQFLKFNGTDRCGFFFKFTEVTKISSLLANRGSAEAAQYVKTWYRYQQNTRQYL